MKVRVKAHGVSGYVVQTKGLLFWNNEGYYVGGGEMMLFKSKVYSSEEEATEAMIKLILSKEREKEAKKRSKTIYTKCSSEEARTKFPEYFT